MQLPQIAQKEFWREEVNRGVVDTNSHVMDFPGMQLRYQNILIDTNDFMTVQRTLTMMMICTKKAMEGRERKFIFSSVCIIELAAQTNELMNCPGSSGNSLDQEVLGIDQ